MEGNVVISKERYLSLLKNEAFLDCLKAGGVDNWEGYGESLHPDDEKSIYDIYQDLELEVRKM